MICDLCENGWQSEKLCKWLSIPETRERWGNKKEETLRKCAKINDLFRKTNSQLVPVRVQIHQSVIMWQTVPKNAVRVIYLSQVFPILQIQNSINSVHLNDAYEASDSNSDDPAKWIINKSLRYRISLNKVILHRMLQTTCSWFEFDEFTMHLFISIIIMQLR